MSARDNILAALIAELAKRAECDEKIAQLRAALEGIKAVDSEAAAEAERVAELASQAAGHHATP